MPRLPNTGNDAGSWGILLNEFLRVSHGEDGHIKSTLSVNNIKDFGAKGDNITNDTIAIQSAINAAVSAGGGIVFFPPGRYITTSTLICSASAVTLLGVGHGSIIVPKGNFDTISFAAPGNAYIYGN